MNLNRSSLWIKRLAEIAIGLNLVMLSAATLFVIQEYPTVIITDIHTKLMLAGDAVAVSLPLFSAFYLRSLVQHYFPDRAL